MILHDRIMRLQTDPHIETLPDGVRVAYKNGHKVARHDAAELSLEADELMAEMAEAMLEYDTMACRDEFGDILQKYLSWKESAK